ncbi:MAG TPA: Gfo/Idh/MocA family oxidoreductase [Candidatus Kapabacteria bacterium]|nr:Gfo/Idh/MocA family oxidoreductase [Candidatus Kapabacteria bacterium]
MDTIKLALVGAGNVGQVVHLPILKRMPDVEVVAVVDPDERKAKAVAARFGIHSTFKTIDALLGSGLGSEINAVDVCTPTDQHSVPAIASLESGKDVLVEKPIARTAKEAKAIADVADKYGRKLMVGMNNRFRPDTMILKSFIENKELGPIYYIKSGWLKQQSSVATWQQQKEKAGGGVFIDLGIVMLDMALWLMNYPEVTTVSATTYYQFTKKVEDSAAVFIRLADGVTLTIETSWTFHREGDFFYCNVFGKQGSAFINPLRVFKQVAGNLVNLTPAKTESQVALYKKSYENELRHFINACRGIVTLTSTGEESVKRMKVVEAIYQSATKQKEIALGASKKK